MSGIFHWCQRPFVVGAALVLAIACQPAQRANAQLTVVPVSDMLLDPDALIMGTRGGFSDSINGRPFQQEALITHGGYQFAAWYHNGAAQDLFISRRRLETEVWETIDTGANMIHGNQFWDSHNSVSMGISGDGRIHLVFDLHSDFLRYVTTDVGFATSSNAVWNQANFAAERGTLNEDSVTLPGGLTYPRFANVGDDLIFTIRSGGAPNGDHFVVEYSSATSQWSQIRQATEGASGETYDDASNLPSSTRNSYHNGFHADPSGRIHTSWTWREGTTSMNHDIMYAYSDDRGVTWKNTFDQTIAAPSLPMTLSTPGIVVADLDRRQALINQQGQIVDNEGGVHLLMYHRRQDPGFEWQPGDGNFFRGDSAYHHYYRNPETGQWIVNRFPNGIAVGSRPRLGVTADGDLYGLYTRNDRLVIAGAQRVADGYSEWSELYVETRYAFEVTPLIDCRRLLTEGVLSVFAQEKSTAPLPFDPTSSSMRVLEFVAERVEPLPQSQFIVGWDRFANSGVIAPSQTDGMSTGTSSRVGFGLDAQLMASPDGTWGTLAAPAADTSTSNTTDSVRLINGAEGYYDFTVTDTSGTDRDLIAFHFDSGTFRPNSSRDFELSVIAGDLTIGTVATGNVPSVVGGEQDWSDFDIPLNTLVDNTLDANGSVTFRIEFTGGTSGAGGHHQYLDNVAVSAAIDGLLGDFDGDNDVDVVDLDRYHGFIGAAATGSLEPLDLDGDGVVGENDFTQHYETLIATSNGLAGTFAGDANLDGVVDVLGDAFTLVSNLGSSATSWAEGDFNFDGVVNVLGDAFRLVGNLGKTNDGS